LRHNQVISLIGVAITQDDIGNQLVAPVERQVFANEYAVSSREYYNAALTGLRPAKEFEVYSFEYAGQERLKHEAVVYRIIRTETRGEKTRLTCERVTADG